MSNFDSQKPGKSAVFLLEQIQKKALQPEQLTKHHKKICVRYLLSDKKYSMLEIGTLMKIPTSTLYRYRDEIRLQNEYMLSDLDERKLALEWIEAGETACARLFRKGKEKDAIEVLTRMMEALQSLGYVKRKPIEIEGDVTLEEILKRGKEKRTELPRYSDNGASQLS